MISGVVLILFGEALVLLSPAHGAWAASFLALNLLYIPLVEEPQLERRFGDAYREYRRHVRRFARAGIRQNRANARLVQVNVQVGASSAGGC